MRKPEKSRLGQPAAESNSKLYVHDFGSILAFTEWNFLGTAGIGTIGQNGYQFADEFAPEWNKGQSGGNVPLLDMFQLTTPRPFHSINVPAGYGPSYFQDYFTNNPGSSPTGPDVTDGDQ